MANAPAIFPSATVLSRPTIVEACRNASKHANTRQRRHVLARVDHTMRHMPKHVTWLRRALEGPVLTGYGSVHRSAFLVWVLVCVSMGKGMAMSMRMGLGMGMGMCMGGCGSASRGAAAAAQ